jgi:hypothetical protein
MWCDRSAGNPPPGSASELGPCHRRRNLLPPLRQGPRQRLGGDAEVAGDLVVGEGLPDLRPFLQQQCHACAKIQSETALLPSTQTLHLLFDDARPPRRISAGHSPRRRQNSFSSNRWIRLGRVASASREGRPSRVRRCNGGKKQGPTRRCVFHVRPRGSRRNRRTAPSRRINSSCSNSPRTHGLAPVSRASSRSRPSSSFRRAASRPSWDSHRREGRRSKS